MPEKIRLNQDPLKPVTAAGLTIFMKMGFEKVRLQKIPIVWETHKILGRAPADGRPENKRLLSTDGQRRAIAHAIFAAHFATGSLYKENGS